MGKMSKDKGKVGEREVAELIRSYGFEARRGQQNRGGSDSPDVVHSIPNVYAEVKFRERFSLWAAVSKAQEEAKDTDTPVVFHRQKRKPWLVTMDAHDFLRILKKVPLVNEAGDNYSMWPPEKDEIL